MTSAELIVCCVCLIEETNPILLEWCSGCGQRYHLNPFHSKPGLDCGDAWVDDNDEEMMLFCNTCMDLARAADATAWAEQAANRGYSLPEATPSATPEPDPAAPPTAPPPPPQQRTDAPPPLRERERPVRRYRRVE